LDKDERDSVDKVIAYYGDKPAWWQVDSRHLVSPWRKARTGVSRGERYENVIPLADMLENYSGLYQRAEMGGKCLGVAKHTA
jgi:uncharacterized phage-associated protein